MNKIVKVIIKGTSGYCSIEDEYKEKITIGQNKVKYHFLPEVVNVGAVKKVLIKESLNQVDLLGSGS